MAKHRLDKRKKRIWGGPELIAMAGGRAGDGPAHAEPDSTEPMAPVATGEPETPAAERAS
jgi:hypothetical protein